MYRYLPEPSDHQFQCMEVGHGVLFCQHTEPLSEHASNKSPEMDVLPPLPPFPRDRLEPLQRSIHMYNHPPPFTHPIRIQTLAMTSTEKRKASNYRPLHKGLGKPSSSLTLEPRIALRTASATMGRPEVAFQCARPLITVPSIQG